MNARRLLNNETIFRFALTVLMAWAVASLLATYGAAAGREAISPEQAGAYVGQHQTVCGKVVSSNYASRSRGRPTFLNLDRPYPRHIFTVVIWGRERQKFKEPPEVRFRDQEICVTGTITVYRSKPQIVVRDPNQISLLREWKPE